MPSHLILSFLFYAFISAITPGPANICSLSTAIHYGRKVALKQWTGLFTGYVIISFGSAILCYLIGTALGGYVHYLSFVGAAYLTYLAFKMLKHTMAREENRGETCNFFTGLFVNLTNVKNILFCVTTFSIYVLPYSSSLGSLLSLAFFLPFTGPIANLAWIFLGEALRYLFSRWQKLLNILMGISLLLCAVSLVI